VTEFDGKDTFVCEHGFASTEQKGETAWPTCRTRAHIALVAARGFVVRSGGPDWYESQRLRRALLQELQHRQ